MYKGRYGQIEVVLKSAFQNKNVSGKIIQGICKVILYQILYIITIFHNDM